MVSRCARMLIASMLAVGTMPAALGKDYEPAHHRNPPQVAKHDADGNTCPPKHDCPAAKRLRIVSIIPNTFPFARDLGDFGNAMVASNWMAKFSDAYDIPGPASAIVIHVDDMPDLNAGRREVSVYRDYVFKVARANGLKRAPQHQTVYLLYIPCNPEHGPRAGMDGYNCSSHHPGIEPVGHEQTVFFTRGDSLAVVLRFNPHAEPDAPQPTLAGFTGSASHEVAEAVTDTRGGPQFSLHTDFPDYPYLDSGRNAHGSPWIRQSGGMELADMSEGTREYEAPSGGSEAFRYERIYSNKASKAGGDPAVPPSPYPYY